MFTVLSEKFKAFVGGTQMKVRDIGVLGAVILIVAMLIIPLPPWMLSF